MGSARPVPREPLRSVAPPSWSSAGSTDRASAARLRGVRSCSRRRANPCRRSWCDLEEERPAEQARNVHQNLVEAWQRAGWNRRIHCVAGQRLERRLHAGHADGAYALGQRLVLRRQHVELYGRDLIPHRKAKGLSESAPEAAEFLRVKRVVHDPEFFARALEVGLQILL